MDPFKVFPIEVIEVMFGSMSAKEVLNCTLVSPQWNKAISSSQGCMRKLSLILIDTNLKNFSKNEIEILKHSRKFTNVKICYRSADLQLICEIMSFRSHWKSVTFFGSGFVTTSDFVKLFKTFESTAEHVALNYVKIKVLESTQLKFNLKKLKSLSISESDIVICEKIFDGCSLMNIESLDLQIFAVLSSSVSLATKIRKCKNIKKLILSNSWYRIFFDDTAPQLDLQLESLQVSNSCTSFMEEPFLVSYKKQKCFNTFLEKQSKTLKRLKIRGKFGTEVVKTAYRMKALEVFIVPNIAFRSWPSLDFDVSSSIKILDITSINICNKEFIINIINCSPNIREIGIQDANSKIVQLMQRKLLNLEKVQVSNAYDHSLQEMLSNVLWN